MTSKARPGRRHSAMSGVSSVSYACGPHGHPMASEPPAGFEATCSLLSPQHHPIHLSKNEPAA